MVTSGIVVAQTDQHIRGAVRGSRRRRRYGGDPAPQHAGRLRAGPHPERQDGSLPVDRRDDVRHRHGAAREGVVDPRTGAFVNHDLAQYLVPVHADIPELDAVVLEGFDDKANVLGAKGLGELGICGADAAVANAVFNATGVRVRDYPIRLDKVMPALPRADP